MFKLINFIIITISTFFASWFALHGDIIFHTDIARDFLLLEDIVKNKPITLIGPRSGGIPGVFHGPLWTYLNLPAFIIGGGNPAAISWFWLILYLANLWIVYKIGSLIFKKEIGLIAATLTSVITAFSVPGLFNPFGAVMMTPIFFYFLYRYIKKEKIKDLIVAVFVLGLIIQFQMAFGMPILMLFLPLLLFIVLRNKKIIHFLALFVLILPLSTFILFDIRHQFLQTTAVINYLSGKENTGKMEKPLTELFKIRMNSAFTNGIGFITKENRWLGYLFLILIATAFYKVLKKNQYKDIRIFYFLVFYFYLGFWLTTVFYQGVIWSYYYWPFLSVVTLMFASIYNFINKKLFYLIFLIFICFNLNKEVKNNFKDQSYFGNDHSSWKFNYKTAKKIFDDAPSEFGYYIFTADQFGYPSKYALNFVASQYKNKKAFPYVKRSVTYLLIFKSNNPTISHDWWRKEKVKINRKPAKIFNYDNNFWIEKYYLNQKEIQEKSDDTLIHNLIFR